MAQGVEPSRGGSGRVGIGNPRDFWGGVVLIALAAFALWASRDLPGMRGFAFGPGTAPRMFAYLLMAMGAGVAVIGYFGKGEKIDQFALRGTAIGLAVVAVFALVSRFSTPIVAALGLRQGETVIASAVVLILSFILGRGPARGPLYVTASILIFAGTIRPLGLVLASFVSLMVSAAATTEVRWVEVTIFSIGMTAFCVFLFPYALNLPFAFWPRF